MALRSLTFGLPEWSAVELSWIKQQTGVLNRLSQSAGQGSDTHKQAFSEIMGLVALGKTEALLALVARSRLHGRVFSAAILNETALRDRVSMTKRGVEALVSRDVAASRLTLAYLVEAYFKFYRSLFDLEAVVALRKRLEIQNKNFYPNFTGFELVDAAMKFPWTLVVKDAHTTLVQRSVQEGTGLNEAFKRYGIADVLNGEFQKACQSVYYIQEIKRLKPGEESPLLEEIIDPDVFELPFDEVKSFGHKFVELLIDKSTSAQVSEPWREAILAIAGDPRHGKHTPNFQRWWAVLGEERRLKMISWLSRLDLKFFLDVLLESYQDSSDANAKRMYNERSEFLNALLNSGKVSYSKLFLSREAIRYVEKNYPHIRSASFGRTSDHSKSVIYLELGDVHFFEGSHDYPIRIYGEKTKRIKEVVSFDKRIWSIGDLGVGLDNFYRKEARISRDMEAIPHLGRSWSNKAQTYLRKKGVRFIV